MSLLLNIQAGVVVAPLSAQAAVVVRSVRRTPSERERAEVGIRLLAEKWSFQQWGVHAHRQSMCAIAPVCVHNIVRAPYHQSITLQAIGQKFEGAEGMTIFQRN